MINRVLPLLAERVGEEQRKHLFLSWGISTAIFVGCALLTTFAPVPRLGLTTQPPMSGSGLWVDEPQRPLLFAFLYYASAAYVELRIHRRVASRG